MGEPGIGKTDTLRTEFSTLEKAVKAKGDEALWLDLHAYTTDFLLEKDLFQNPKMTGLHSGTHSLHLWLDGLDECLLRVESAVRLMATKFKEFPRDRIKLRISCRTGAWLSSYEDALVELWGGNAVQAFELVPLRATDISEAATQNSIKPEDFLNALSEKNVVPLAIKPITLNFLLNQFKANQVFPSTQKELYFEGCLRLCEERRPEVLASRKQVGLNGRQKLEVAKRVAALSIFGKKAAVWFGVDEGDVPSSALKLIEIVGGKEKVNGDEFVINEFDVREALDTGLFSSRGSNQLGWAHQTYAEFLAASYVIGHNCSLSQLCELLVHPSDPQGKLVPQLHETAAWIASERQDLFDRIIISDPEVLLRSDIGAGNPAAKSVLAKGLLAAFDRETVHDFNLDFHQYYARLSHSKIQEDLAPFVRDKAKSVMARIAAVDIAEACKTSSLQKELLSVVLDNTEQLYIRKNAAIAISKIGDAATKSSLNKLLSCSLEEDPDDDLKGAALCALWPELIDTKVLFETLTSPRNLNLYGTYKYFLNGQAFEHLSVADLPIALDWVESHDGQDHYLSPFDSITRKIMLFAWDNLDDPILCEKFARVAMSRLKNHQAVIDSKGFSEEKSNRFLDELPRQHLKRRKLLGAVVRLSVGAAYDLFCITHGATPLVFPLDVPWLIEQLEKEIEPKFKAAWVEIIGWLPNRCDPKEVDLIIGAARRTALLGAKLSWLIEPVDLGSPQAKEFQRQLERQKQYEAKSKKESRVPKVVKGRILKRLTEIEQGKSEEFWPLTLDLARELHRGHIESGALSADVTELDIWKALEQSIQDRITSSAKVYLEKYKPDIAWIGESVYHWPCFAGFKALVLLSDDKEYRSKLSVDFWRTWAPVIVAFPAYSGHGTIELQREFIKLAYQFAPEQVVETILKLIEKENREGEHIPVLDKAKGCFDERLGQAILERTMKGDLKSAATRALLGLLVRHRIKGAEEYLKKQIRLPLSGKEPADAEIIEFATEFLLRSPDTAWFFLWPEILKDDRFGKELLGRIANQVAIKSDFASRLTEGDLGDLFIWLCKHYPYKEDPPQRSGAMSRRDHLRMFRDGIIQTLANRGTEASCEAIRKAIVELPEISFLRRYLLDAERKTRGATWSPPNPGVILRLTSDPDARVIQNGEQLLEVLGESLSRLEKRLHGTTPAIFDLWNEQKDGTFRPVDENSFSDYVKRHLESDLKARKIVLNREVEIRRSGAERIGECTDIQVDSFVSGARGGREEQITAVIEVKGSWHAELSTAMGTQLVGRYLKENKTQHGLYLVGFFASPKWDDSDYRKGKTKSLNPNVLEKDLAQQAKTLSENGIYVKSYLMNTSFT